jgi:hypothetical protein
MTSQSVNLQYDRDKNEYIPILKQPQSQYNTIQPLNMVFITEDERILLSPPKRDNPVNNNETDNFPFVLQLYIGALSVIGLYVVYRYVK